MQSGFGGDDFFERGRRADLPYQNLINKPWWNKFCSAWPGPNAMPLCARAVTGGCSPQKPPTSYGERLQSALSGKRAVERSSPWSDALGESVCAPAITLYQDS